MNLIEKYPDRVPVVIVPKENIKIDRVKFLIPKEYPFGKFVSYIVSSFLEPTNSKQAYYFFTKENTLVPTSILMSSLYESHKDPDHMLRLSLRIENTFG